MIEFRAYSGPSRSRHKRGTVTLSRPNHEVQNSNDHSPLIGMEADFLSIKNRKMVIYRTRNGIIILTLDSLETALSPEYNNLDGCEEIRLVQTEIVSDKKIGEAESPNLEAKNLQIDPR